MAGDLPGWLVNCGWASLLERVGETDMPTGEDVVLAQVEAQGSSGEYIPNPNDSDLDHPLYIRPGGGSTQPSSHATMVAKHFFGASEGLARGVSYVYCYNANGFLTNHYLHVNTTAAPDHVPIIKVWNHSWVAQFGNETLDLRANRKLDFMIERDDDVVCVGLNNSAEQVHLLAGAFNSIAVGRRDGQHSGGLWTLGDGQNRVRPDLVGPLYTTSQCTGIVSGGASMLVQTAVDADLGADGEASETIKAALMAGAVHQNTSGVPWSNDAVATGADRGLSTQALDLNCGAGHMNIDRSHQLLTAGQVASGGSGSTSGWAFETVAEGGIATFRFTSTSTADVFNAVAVWNRGVSSASNYGVWWVADLDLELRLVSGNDTISLLGDGATEWVSGNVASRSTVGNVEHLHITGLEPGTYELQVTSNDAGSGASSTDVALAWWSDADAGSSNPGDINGDGAVNVTDLLIVLKAWGHNPGHPADLDGDDMVGVDDLLLFLSYWDT
ncbi:MAG: hypothetical protein MK074_02875 [Phycisphaerales bacterium]|nr:hypothetical protein [Phycisphaerales bacterium]